MHPSSRGTSTPGSPAAAIVARVHDQVVGYRDLAALPRDKSILQVERPDLMTYQPHLTFSPLDLPRRQRSLSPPPSSPTTSPEVKEQRAESDSGSPGGSMLQLHVGRTVSGNHQHFHRPDNGANIYGRPPIYKHEVNKHFEGVVQSAKFPAAQPPDPNVPSKIETEFWPCPPSLAAMEMEWRKRKELQEEDKFEDLTGEAETLQEQALEKIKSNLGRLILKEEKDKNVHFRRKTQSLPDRTHMHASKSPVWAESWCPEEESHLNLLPVVCLQMQSAEFSTDKDNEQAAAEVSVSLTCLLHVSYMSSTCLLRVVYMSPACLLRVVYMSPACLLRVVYMSPACLLRVAYMSPTCRLHVSYVSPTCLLRVAYMSPTCRLHVSYVSSTCLLRVAYMSPTRRLHVSYVSSTCLLRVAYMSPTCRLHVSCMSPTRRLHVSYVSSTCLLHVSYTSPTCLLRVVYMSPACLLHVAYMSPTCRLHVSYTSPTCLLRVSCMSPTRRLHVSYASPTCLLRVAYMSPTCHLHVSYVSSTCLLHVSYVSSTCLLRVAYMSPTCRLHVSCSDCRLVFTECSCSRLCSHACAVKPACLTQGVCACAGRGGSEGEDGQRELSPQYPRAEDSSLRSAGCDPQGALQAAAGSRPHSPGEASVPGVFPAALRDADGRV
ncbi:dematin isoform X2 [Gasterosteus aculeatus]